MPKYIAQLLIEGKDTLEEIQEWLNTKLVEELCLDHNGMDVTSVLGVVQLPPLGIDQYVDQTRKELKREAM